MIDLGFNDSDSTSSWISYKPQKDEWQYSEGEVDFKHFVLDIDSFKTGWGKIQRGAATEWSWDDDINLPKENPATGTNDEENWTRGFYVELYTEKEGSMFLATTTMGTKRGFNVLWTEVEKAKADNPGLLPVVEYEGSESAFEGKSRIPGFRIRKWTERPAEFEKIKSPEVSSNIPVEDSPQTQTEDDIPF